MLRVVVASGMVLAMAGCASEAPEQQTARELVEIHLADDADYDGHVHCTGNPRPWFVERQATVYICAARRNDGDCDWFRVTTGEDRPTVALDRERAGCVLPA